MASEQQIENCLQPHFTAASEACLEVRITLEAGVDNQTSTNNTMEYNTNNDLQQQDVAAVGKIANVLGNEQIGAVADGQNEGGAVPAATPESGRQIGSEQMTTTRKPECFGIAETAIFLTASGASVSHVGQKYNFGRVLHTEADLNGIVISGCRAELAEKGMFIGEDRGAALSNRDGEGERLRRLLIVSQYDGQQKVLDDLCRLAWRVIVGCAAGSLSRKMIVGGSWRDLEIVKTAGFGEWRTAVDFAKVMDPELEHFHQLLEVMWEHMHTPEHRHAVDLLEKKMAKGRSLKGEALRKLLVTTPLNWQVPPCGPIPKRLQYWEDEEEEVETVVSVM